MQAILNMKFFDLTCIFKQDTWASQWSTYDFSFLTNLFFDGAVDIVLF